MIKMAVSTAVKSGKSIKIHVPELVAEAAGIEPGDQVSLYVDSKIPFAFMVRKATIEDIDK